jgi:redox-sensitive bicupin YhaK (pirin superfamily)
MEKPMSRSNAGLGKRHETRRINKTITGHPHKIGTGFSAIHFSEDMFGGDMDPLIMVDHFVMTEPTFEPHLHAGISAVTFIFEDAAGNFLNRDTLGNNIALEPGDLYWLTAASGAVHDERPDPKGARTHALQIFVNLPARLKLDGAQSLHVRAGDMPILSGPGYRVRLALGHSGDVSGSREVAQGVTILDGTVNKAGRFEHRLPAREAAWLYAVSGELLIQIGAERSIVPAGSSVTVAATDEDVAILLSGAETHFVLLASSPLREPFVKHGPLVMSSLADVRRTLTDYTAGKFGRIAG